MVRDQLSNALGSLYARLLQLEHAKSNSVHIQHDVWSFRLCTGRVTNRNLFGNSEVVELGVFPVDVVKPLILLPKLTIGNAVAQQRIDPLVQLVERRYPILGQILQLLESLNHGKPRISPTVEILLQVFVVDWLIGPTVQVSDVFVAQIMN